MHDVHHSEVVVVTVVKWRRTARWPHCRHGEADPVGLHAGNSTEDEDDARVCVGGRDIFVATPRPPADDEDDARLHAGRHDVIFTVL